jgi:hypothetical protein
MRRHIMRDIGYSRRRCQHLSASNGATPNSGHAYADHSEDIVVPRGLEPTLTAPVDVDDESYWVLRHCNSTSVFLMAEIRLTIS